MGKTKIRINTVEYNNNGKITTCNIKASVNLHNVLNGVKNSNLYLMLFHSGEWERVVKKYKSEFVDINDNYIEIRAVGKSVCHDDDGFDEKIGNNIAEKRALMKVYNIWFAIIREIYCILNNQSEILSGIGRKCLEVMNDIDENISGNIDKEINYWT